MLMQSFKTAQSLHILEAQRQALIKTLVLLETGKLTKVNDADAKDDWRRVKNFTGHFNMSCWRDDASCGTIACIGGTAELIGNVVFDLEHLPSQLDRLFHPPSCIDWEAITIAQAATALRSYLTTGCARWDLAMKS